MKSLAMLLAVPAALCAGCQNNTVELTFETDNGANGLTASNTASNTSGVATTNADADGVTDVADDGPRPMPPIPGNWLLSVSSTLDPTLPFQFLVLAEEIGPGTFNLTMTSLSLEIGSTTAPRLPVGEPKIFFSVPLTPDAGFEIFTGPLVIPGAANPITGTEVTVDILLSGMPTGQPFCGVVTGSVTAPAPADLAGSTFGTEKIEDVGALPATFATAC